MEDALALMAKVLVSDPEATPLGIDKDDDPSSVLSRHARIP
jgi:hypothetical protein